MAEDERDEGTQRLTHLRKKQSVLNMNNLVEEHRRHDHSSPGGKSPSVGASASASGGSGGGDGDGGDGWQGSGKKKKTKLRARSCHVGVSKSTNDLADRVSIESRRRNMLAAGRRTRKKPSNDIMGDAKSPEGGGFDGGESKKSDISEQSALKQKLSLSSSGKRLSSRSMKRREKALRRGSEKLRVIAGKKELTSDLLAHVKAGDPQHTSFESSELHWVNLVQLAYNADGTRMKKKKKNSPKKKKNKKVKKQRDSLVVASQSQSSLSEGSVPQLQISGYSEFLLLL